ncbi:MAG: T9SS type A sorting domain-containing protein [bacterium]
MANLGRLILCSLFIGTLLSFPSGAEDVTSQPVEFNPEGQFSASGGIVLRLEWNNPFNPEASDPDDRYTRIYYKVKEPGTDIKIYSINGELVRTLAEDKAETEDTIVWNGRNDKGKIVGSGVYLVNLKIGKSSKTIKVVVLR